jgi:hypothetical protein
MAFEELLEVLRPCASIDTMGRTPHNVQEYLADYFTRYRPDLAAAVHALNRDQMTVLFELIHRLHELTTPALSKTQQ